MPCAEQLRGLEVEGGQRLIEAAACGRPVVVGDRACPRGPDRRETGILVDGTDVEEVAAPSATCSRTRAELA